MIMISTLKPLHNLANSLSSTFCYYLDDHVLEQGFEDVARLVICYLFSYHSWDQWGNLLRHHLGCTD